MRTNLLHSLALLGHGIVLRRGVRVEQRAGDLFVHPFEVGVILEDLSVDRWYHDV